MKKHVCPWWLAYTFDNPLRRLFHNPEKIVSPYLKEGMSAIDIGCGMGYFSIAMAKVVGHTGKIISVDLQQEMLDTVVKRANKVGVASRITTFLCDESTIGMHEDVDFALTFWMVHEAASEVELLKQVFSILKPSGRLLLAEPKGHVTVDAFEKTLLIAQQSGFRLIDSPKINFSYSAVLEKQ